MQKIDEQHEAFIKKLELKVNKEDEEEFLRMKEDVKLYTRVGFRNELDKPG